MAIQLKTITQGERGTITFTWQFPPLLTSPATIQGAAITAVAKNRYTGDITQITGTLTGTTATTVTWALSDGDSGTPGTYAVIFKAVVSGVNTYTAAASLVIEAFPAATAVQNPLIVGVTAAMRAALDAANEPSGANPVATMADIEAGGILDAPDDVNYLRTEGEWIEAGSAAVEDTSAFDPAGSAGAVQDDLDLVKRPTQTDVAGTTHTFTTANEGQIVASQSGSATEFTIPLNSSQVFAVGAIVGVEQQGAGTLTIKATAGVLLNGVDGDSKAIAAQWDAAAIRKISTNGWIIIGALS